MNIERKARAATLVAAGMLAALALVVPQATGITNGVPDKNAHPNVGALIGTFDGGKTYFFVCTGSLLGDREFLTAAHCTPWETIGQTADGVFVTFDTDLQIVGSTEWGPLVDPDNVIGLDRKNPRTVMEGYWLPPSQAFSRNDVAVLHLAANASKKYPRIKPIELPTPWFLSERAANGRLVGHSFTLVGYGLQETGFNGLRMLSSAPFLGLTEDHVTLLGNPSATGEGATGLGDSGGPDFFGPAGAAYGNLAVALNTGRGHIAQPSLLWAGAMPNQRLDLPQVLEFLEPWAD